LQEQEGVMLAQLDQAHVKLTQERQEYVSSVSERKSLLDTLIEGIKMKHDQPAVEFLMGPLRVVSPRCEAAKAPIPEPVSPELQRTVASLSEISKQILAVMTKFKGKVKKWRAMPRLKVTLDPETASPYLTISRDRKTLRMGKEQQNLPDTPKRFTGSASVLGSQG
ncbi:TRI15 protein, partial [Chauna torquata]|nr:TRI15 protein [Chauna torquata]